jgi:hypothetical protein
MDVNEELDMVLGLIKTTDVSSEECYQLVQLLESVLRKYEKSIKVKH